MTMQLLIDQTGTTADLDGVACRLWEGTGPDGGRFAVWVHRVQPRDGKAEGYAAACLDERPAPARRDVRAVQLGRDELATIAARWVVDREGEACASRSQSAVTRAVKSAVEDGEPAVAVALILLIGARSSGLEGEALRAISEALAVEGAGLSASLLPPAGAAEPVDAERPAGA